MSSLSFPWKSEEWKILSECAGTNELSANAQRQLKSRERLHSASFFPRGLSKRETTRRFPFDVSISSKITEISHGNDLFAEAIGPYSLFCLNKARTFGSYLDLPARYLPHNCWIKFSRVDIYLVIRCRDGELADQGKCNYQAGQIAFLPWKHEEKWR